MKIIANEQNILELVSKREIINAVKDEFFTVEPQVVGVYIKSAEYTHKNWAFKGIVVYKYDDQIEGTIYMVADFDHRSEVTSNIEIEYHSEGGFDSFEEVEDMYSLSTDFKKV